MKEKYLIILTGSVDNFDRTSIFHPFKDNEKACDGLNVRMQMWFTICIKKL